MLNHNSDNLQDPVFHGDARVTPEEFNRALVAIEGRQAAEQARRDEEATRQSSTVPINYIIEELKLDVSSKDIYDEVLRQRQQETDAIASAIKEMVSGCVEDSARVETAASATTKTRWFALCLVFVCIAIITFAIDSVMKMPAFSVAPSAARPKSFPDFVLHDPDPNFYVMLNQTIGPNPKYRLDVVTPYQIATGLRADSASSPLYPPRAVPDGFRVYDEQFGDMNDRDSIQGSNVGVQLTPMTADPLANDLAVLIKHNGRLYREFWMQTQDVPKFKAGHQVTLESYPLGADSALYAPDRTSVTVPWSSKHTWLMTQHFQKRPMSFSGSGPTYDNNNPEVKASANDVILDRYAWLDPAAVPAFNPPSWVFSPDVFGSVTFQHNLVAYDQEQKSNPYCDTNDFDASAHLEKLESLSDGQRIRVSYNLLVQICFAIRQGRTDSFYVDTR